jgi:putative transposase
MYDPRRHHRRSIRLRGYDYAQAGEYFVTICTLERECILGTVTDGAMLLSSVGEIVKRCWGEIPGHFHNVELGEFVIMPNHLHGVILLREIPRRDEVTSSLRNDSEIETTQPIVKRPATLGQIVALYKYRSTKLINVIRSAPGKRFWQRNYYEHIIRDGDDYARIRNYIAENVGRWSEDKELSEGFPSSGIR